MQKIVAASIALLLVTLGWGHRSLGEQVPTPQGELRIVDKHAENYLSITMNVFESLVEVDHQGAFVPRLATGWRWLNDRILEVTLRQGVTFHNGEVLDTEIVQLNWEETKKGSPPFFAGHPMNFHPASRLEIADPQTVRFIFPEPDGAALTKLNVMHIGNRQFWRELGRQHW